MNWRLLTTALGLMGGMFFFGSSVYASEWSQTEGSSDYSLYSNVQAISANKPTTSHTLINNFQFQLKAVNYGTGNACSYNNENLRMQLDYNGTSVTENIAFSVYSSTASFQWISIDFSGTAIYLDEITSWRFLFNGNCNFFSKMNLISSALPSDWQDCALCSLDGNSGYIQQFTIDYGDPPTYNSIDWQTPNFTDGMSTPDFVNWYTCVDIITSPFEATQNGYYVKVNYGSSTTSMTTVDSGYTQFGSNPIYSLPTNECVLLEKTSSSSPDSLIYAYPTLWRYRADIGHTQIATGSTISIYITGGDIVLEPGTPNYPKEYTGTDPYRIIFQKKFPFEYIYQLSDLADYLETSATSSTFTELSLVWPALTGYKATTTIPFFSKTKMLEILPMSTWDFIRTLEGAGVIIMTGFYFFGRIKSFHHGGDENG